MSCEAGIAGDTKSVPLRFIPELNAKPLCSPACRLRPHQECRLHVRHCRRRHARHSKGVGRARARRGAKMRITGKKCLQGQPIISQQGTRFRAPCYKRTSNLHSHVAGRHDCIQITGRHPHDGTEGNLQRGTAAIARAVAWCATANPYPFLYRRDEGFSVTTL